MNKKNLYSTISMTLAITLVYGFIYSGMKEDFGFTDDPLDPYYFSLTTMSTVGYGDFSPKTRRAKLLVMSHQLVILAELASFIKKIVK
jgi:hypothetical protein